MMSQPTKPGQPNPQVERSGTLIEPSVKLPPGNRQANNRWNGPAR